MQNAALETIPARVARLQAHLQLVFWLGETDAPEWIEDGLENLFSMDMGALIQRNSADLRAITPFPPDQMTLNQVPRAALAQRMMRVAFNQSSAVEAAETEAHIQENNDGEVVTGTALAKLDSTRDLSFFYAQYGAGAFVETLQRLAAAKTSSRRCKRPSDCHKTSSWPPPTRAKVKAIAFQVQTQIHGVYLGLNLESANSGIEIPRPVRCWLNFLFHAALSSSLFGLAVRRFVGVRFGARPASRARAR